MGKFLDFFFSKRSREDRERAGVLSLREKLEQDYREDGYDKIPYIVSEGDAHDLLKQIKLSKTLLPHKSYMTFINDDKLVFGHVIMLWWIKNVNRKRSPKFFSQEYGLNYKEEFEWLKENGYVDENTLTSKGEEVLSRHPDIIDHHQEKFR
ncbi:hypothetical protein HMPREF2767_04565 [Nosocomiicoccus sp. HMSC067E10]|uniref:hypothetical protein n=1 Tax=Nosocomiicoccus sp. HMSC067E10 TaxID=1739271 RepID=UPI0008A48F1C|nr:hypothetical protein [Nosocomiicoccus sp. HMSC067E10]OFL46187.1 hypothetical protein HMPREF2767_04565 [Nosocomiicoccus sp. HMSC067E10]